MKFFQRFGAILLIIAAVFVAYAPALRNGFVWDDTALVLRDPLVRSWRLIPEGFRHFLFLDATGSNFYRPLQRLTYVADYAIWGFAHPGGWHFTSIAIHAAAAAALFLLLRKWWGESRVGWAFAVALVWAIHPLHTSAVTYVAGRADLLAAFCGFVGLGFLLRSLEADANSTPLRLIAALCFLGAILSKESGAIFLALATALLAWKRMPARSRFHWGGLLVAVLSVYCTLRFTAHKTPPPPPRPIARADTRVAIAARAVTEYAGLIIAPVTLRMERDVSLPAEVKPTLSDRVNTMRRAQSSFGMVLILGIAVWFTWARRRAPEAAAALMGAVMAYLPISNLIPLNATLAEHWLYVPSALLFAATAASLYVFPRLHRPVLAGVCLWAGWLAVRTWQRQPDWRDQRTFLERNTAAGGDSARMHVNLGSLAFSEGNVDAAVEEYREALRRDPNLGFAHLGLANAELKLKHFSEARAELDLAAATLGLEAEKVQLRGALDAAEKRLDPTASFRAAADLVPWNWTFRRRYLSALAETGRLPQAISELRAFLDQQPFRADSWQLLAQFLSRAGHAELAAAAMEEARERDVRLP